MPETEIYTIISTGVDSDRGHFPAPQTEGSFLDLQRARNKLNQLIETEKEELDDRYDREERTEDCWETYMDGYAAALFSRIEILTSYLMDGSGAL